MLAILIISVVLNVALSFFLIRFIKRARQYDEMVTSMMEDVQINVEYFDKILSTPMLSNSPEVKAMKENQATMRDRFVQYIDEHFKGRKTVTGPPPVGIDV